MKLTEALAAWRRSRAAVIAEAIDALSDEALKSGPTAPKERLNAVFQARWLEALKDDVARGWALSNLSTQLPGNDTDLRRDSLCVRLEALEALAADPRVSKALLALLDRSPPYLAFVEPLTRIGRCLAVHGDERTSEALKTGAFDERVLMARPKIDFSALTAAERARWVALIPPKRPTPGLEALLAAVEKNPADDQPRAVLADLLQERGDPRGEFIALQLSEARTGGTDEERARAAALLQQHKRAWLGTLARITSKAEFQRGFVHTLHLAGSWAAEPGQWAALANEPSLATVVRLIPGEANLVTYQRFLSGSGLMNLQGLDVFADALSPILGARAEELTHVSCTSWLRGDVETRFVNKVLGQLEAMPRLRSVGVTDALLPPLVKSTLWKRLERLELEALFGVGLSQYRKRSPAFPIVIRNLFGTLELDRGASAQLTAHPSTRWGDVVSEFASGLPAHVKRLELHAGKTVTAALAAAFAKRKNFELVSRPPPSGFVSALKAT